MTDRILRPCREITAAATVLALLGIVACNEVTGPVSSSVNGPRTELVDARNSGESGFYFLPPLAPSVAYSGTFDPDRAPRVEICLMSGGSCGSIVSRFDRESSFASEVLRVDTATQRYIVNWHTRQFALASNSMYRISVLIGATELGHADVSLVGSNGERKNVPSGVLPLVNGATLPIAFRIEQTVPVLPALVPEPGSGMPGKRLVISGFTVPVAEQSSFRLSIGGEPAPFILDANGKIVAAVPLFLGPDKWPAPPAAPVDIVLSREGVDVAAGLAALTVLPLQDAPGRVAELKLAVDSIAASLNRLAEDFPGEAGVEQLYLSGVAEGLKRLIDGPGAYSFNGAIADLAANDPASLRLLNALVASTGMASGFEAYASWMSAVTTTPSAVLGFSAFSAGKMAPSTRGGFLTQPSEMAALFNPDVVTEVSDFGLSRRMQLYEVMKLFTETVVDATGTTFAETVAVASGVLGIAGCIPSVTLPTTVISTMLNVLSWGLNKALLGLLPSNITRFELSIPDATLKPGEITDATLSITAVNTPPTLNVLEVTDMILATLGAAGLFTSCTRIEDFKEALQNTLTFTLDMIRAGLAAYNNAHPELNLSVPLFETIGLHAWNARGTSTNLIDRFSQAPNIVAPEPLEVNWRASETNIGSAGVYARPKTGPGTLNIGLPSGIAYAEGAFGDDFPQSNVVTVEVIPDLAMDELDFPLTLEEDEQGLLVVRAGYLNASGQIVYAAGINLTLSATGGVLAAYSGVTDANGRFTTLGMIGPSSDRIDILVTASAYGDQVQKTAAATLVCSPTPALFAQSVITPSAACEQVTLSVTPTSAEIVVGQTQQYTATVGGTSNTNVTWSAEGGSIDAGGLYTAGSEPGTYDVVARSVADTTVADTVEVTVLPPAQVTYGGNGNAAIARAAASVIGSSSSPIQLLEMDTLATSGSLTANAVSSTVSNSTSRAQGSSRATNDLSLDIAGTLLTGGSGNGSLDVSLMAEGPGAVVSITSSSTFSIEFTASAAARLTFTGTSTMSGTCGTVGRTNVRFGTKSSGGASLFSGVGGTTVTRDIQLAAGTYILSFNINCSPLASVNSGTGGTRSGDGSFNIDFQLKPF